MTAELTSLEVTDAELGALAGVSARRIRQLAEQGTLTRCRPGRFLLGEAFAALIEEASGQGSELNRQRTRKTRADADRAELELAKARGEVAPIAEMESVWQQACGVIRANMLQVPRRVVTSLIGETDERRFCEVLTEEITLALNTAADANFIPEDDTDE